MPCVTIKANLGGGIICCSLAYFSCVQSRVCHTRIQSRKRQRAQMSRDTVIFAEMDRLWELGGWCRGCFVRPTPKWDRVDSGREGWWVGHEWLGEVPTVTQLPSVPVSACVGINRSMLASVCVCVRECARTHTHTHTHMHAGERYGGATRAAGEDNARCLPRALDARHGVGCRARRAAGACASGSVVVRKGW